MTEVISETPALLIRVHLCLISLELSLPPGRGLTLYILLQTIFWLLWNLFVWRTSKTSIKNELILKLQKKITTKRSENRKTCTYCKKPVSGSQSKAKLQNHIIFVGCSNIRFVVKRNVGFFLTDAFSVKQTPKN